MHAHDHDHPPAPDAGTSMPSYYEIMETSVRELLIEKQLIGPGEIRRQIEVARTRTVGEAMSRSRGRAGLSQDHQDRRETPRR